MMIKENKKCKKVQISEISSELLEKKVYFEAMLPRKNSLKQKVLESRIISLTCEKCKKILKKVDLSKEENFYLTYKMLTTGKLKIEDIKQTWQNDCNSEKEGVHKPVIEVEKGDMLDYVKITVKDGKTKLNIYFVGKVEELKDFNKVEIYGYILKNPKTNELEVISYQIEPSKEEIKRAFKKELEKGKKLKEEITGYTVKTEKAEYTLLRSDGLTLHHAGWYIDYGNYRSFAQLFYAFSEIKKRNKEKIKEEKKILPFIFECKYDENGKIIETKIIPVNELEYIELPDMIAKVEKKTLGVSSLPSQLPLEVVLSIINNSYSEISLKEIYSEILEKIKRFVDMEEINLKIATLWTISTYFTEVFQVIPLLIFIGPAGSGKTRTLEIICNLAKKGLPITNPTDHNLPRIIDAWKPTLGLDDLDEVMRRNRQMVFSLLKHVYKHTVQIPRLTPKRNKFYIELFSPFTPVIITTTEPIEEGQLFSRCIFLEMKKSKKKLPNRDPDIFYFKKEREELYLLSYLLAPKIAKTFDELDVPLKGRNFEIWAPILTIAKLIDENLYNEILEKALEEEREREEEIYKEEKIILRAIEKMFEDSPLENMKGEKYVEFTAKELKDKIEELLVNDWKEETEVEFEKRWKSQKIGRVLSRLNIPQKRMTGGVRKRIVTESFLTDLKERYGISDISDNSDNKVDIHKEENLEKNIEKTAKNGISEKVSEGMHVDNVVTNVTIVTQEKNVPKDPVSLLPINEKYPIKDWENQWLEMNEDKNRAREIFWEVFEKAKKEGRIFEAQPGFVVRVF